LTLWREIIMQYRNLLTVGRARLVLASLLGIVVASAASAQPVQLPDDHPYWAQTLAALQYNGNNPSLTIEDLISVTVFTTSNGPITISRDQNSQLVERRAAEFRAYSTSSSLYCPTTPTPRRWVMAVIVNGVEYEIRTKTSCP
jgi:hypothetical protein